MDTTEGNSLQEAVFLEQKTISRSCTVWGWPLTGQRAAGLPKLWLGVGAGEKAARSEAINGVESMEKARLESIPP